MTIFFLLPKKSLSEESYQTWLPITVPPPILYPLIIFGNWGREAWKIICLREISFLKQHGEQAAAGLCGWLVNKGFWSCPGTLELVTVSSVWHIGANEGWPPCLSCSSPATSFPEEEFLGPLLAGRTVLSKIKGSIWIQRDEESICWPFALLDTSSVLLYRHIRNCLFFLLEFFLIIFSLILRRGWDKVKYWRRHKGNH